MYRYLTAIAKTATVIIPVIISGFVIALEKSIPCVLYEIVSVAINIAGKAANIPPITGPAVFAISTVNITTRPPNKERRTR